MLTRTYEQSRSAFVPLPEADALLMESPSMMRNFPQLGMIFGKRGRNVLVGFPSADEK